MAWITYGGVQCGFCTPGFIVSAKALLDLRADPTRNEVRQWFQKHQNVCRCTGYVPIVDSVMAAAKVLRGELTMDDITYKHPEKSSLYGTYYPRPTALAKVCGTADYGDDIAWKMPAGTLHLAIVQPGLSHAIIKNVDFTEAEKMDGVVKVITAADVKGTNRINIPVIHPRSKANGSERPILADEKVFRYGDAVAVVAADTRAHARAAAAKVRVELAPLPENLSCLDSVLPDATRVHEDMPNIYIQQPLYKGEDVRPILENSPFMVEGSFQTSREPHLSIEPDVVQGYWGEDGMLTIQCKSQAIKTAQQSIAKGIGVEADNIRIIENPTGASFGYATSPGSYALVGACVTILNRPVTLTMSYEEHQHFSGKRTPSYTNARLSCDAEGRLNALEFDMAIDHGPYTELAHALLSKVVRFIAFPYNVPNVTGLAKIVHTNHNFGVAYRGFGSPQVYTVSETLMDMLAEKIGLDPFEFRYLNVAKPGETNLNGYLFKQYPMLGIMDRLRPLYLEAKERVAGWSGEGKKRGVGLAWGGFNVTIGAFDRAEVALELNPDGTVTHYNTWEDQGQGGDIGTLTLTVEALKPLGLQPDQVRLVMNDSKLCPDTGIAAGSRSHYMAGNATIYAAGKLLEAKKKPDGGFRSHAEMTDEGIPTKYKGLHELSNTGCCGINPNTGEGDPTPTYMYGLFMSEVEVDLATGKTIVLSLTMVGDVGVIGNKLAVEGQAYGGLSHCVGFALSENYEDLKRHTNLVSSGVPQILDVPDNITLIHIENARLDGPFGSSGCSELYQSGGHMAIINAIYQATGVRIFELPATAEKVKTGLAALARGEAPSPPDPYFLGAHLYDALAEIKANPV
jgi:aldehyde oxidoreductase